MTKTLWPAGAPALDLSELSDALLASASLGFAALAAYLFVSYTLLLVSFLTGADVVPPDGADVAAVAASVGVVVVGLVSWWAGRPLVAVGSAAYIRNVALVRYLLAYVLVGYGFAKISGEQFTSSQSTLDTPLGDVTGIELAWRFFGYSFAYTLFVAAGQIAGSTLLLWRRTTTLGALVLLPILSNIVFINFTHGIPVKLFSGMLLVMNLYLLASDASRLKLILFDDRLARLRAARGGTKHWRTAAKAAAVAVIFLFNGVVSYRGYVEGQQESPIAGVWEVGKFVVDGVHRAASTDATAWRRVYFEPGGIASIKAQASRAQKFRAEYDEAAHRVTMTSFSPPAEYVVDYERLETGELRLTLDRDSERVEALLRRVK